MQWRVLIPVKPVQTAKSRLRGVTHEVSDHPELVRALQADTIAAVSTAARLSETIAGIYLIGDGADWVRQIAFGGPAVGGPPIDGSAVGGPAVGGPAADGSAVSDIALLADPGGGLNAALSFGAERLARIEPSTGVIALLADLPALQPGELIAVLERAALVERGFVPDAQGSGTTMLTAAAGHALSPAFGIDSARRHRESGAVELDAGPGARTDVDTADDLRRCLELGVGVHTLAAAALYH